MKDIGLHHLIMANLFRFRTFCILFVIGLASVIFIIAQDGHLSRNRMVVRYPENNPRSRMHSLRSQQALQNYRAWARRHQGGGNNELPEEDADTEDAVLHYRAKTQQLLQAAQKSTITRNEIGKLPAYKVRSQKQHILPDFSKAAVRREELDRRPKKFSDFGLPSVNNKRWNNSPDDKVCSPRKAVAFFKMHKCSSSTVQNILFRFGEQHSLDFVLPPTNNILGRSYFNKRQMIQFPVDKYNVLCHHTRFSAEGFAEVMREDAVYVTIIRDPVQMYESLFTYLDIGFRFNLPQEEGLERFMQRPLYYYQRNIYTNSHVKNPMLYDLGLQEFEQFNMDQINKKIVELTDQLDLVMITEYFDESLVLLRHLMCWEIDDMVYFKLNARSKASVQTLSTVLAERTRNWNSGDVLLYDVFNVTFWRRIQEFGVERMREEVQALRERIEFYTDYCIDKVVDHDERVWHPYGIKIDSFKLRPESRNDPKCSRMIKSELPYTQTLRLLQLRRYNMHESVDIMM